MVVGTGHCSPEVGINPILTHQYSLGDLHHARNSKLSQGPEDVHKEGESVSLALPWQGGGGVGKKVPDTMHAPKPPETPLAWGTTDPLMDKNVP